VWVPTQFHATVFAAGGVEKGKLVVVPEAVDTRFFTPDAEPLPYPVVTGFEGEQLFTFLSIFKWEERKGWKFLLEAFIREFSKEDKVVLWILTNAYHTDNDFQERIDEYAPRFKAAHSTRMPSHRTTTSSRKSDQHRIAWGHLHVHHMHILGISARWW
jgi:glycosyltransferase involved in cell wall biosynthesis